MQKNKNGYPEADKVMKRGMLKACHQGLVKIMMNHINNSIDLFILSKTN